jgi:hypothetical protein
MKAALSALLALVALCAPARAAQHEVQTGSIMICDTKKQIERYVTFLNIAGKEETAVRTVNTEAEDPNACALSNIAYIRGARVGVVRTSNEAFEIFEILAIGLNTPAGWRAAQPGIFFTLVKVKEYAA